MSNDLYIKLVQVDNDVDMKAWEVVVDRLEREFDGLVVMGMAAVMAEVPAYSTETTPAELALLRAAVEANLSLLIRIARRRQEALPTELDFARVIGSRRAGQGFPVEGLLGAYRVGARVIARWIEATSGHDAAELRAALSLISVLVEHADRVSKVLVDAYVKERQRLVAEAMALQRDLLDHLLGGTLSPEDEQRLHVLGLEPGRPYAIFVVRVDDSATALRQTLDTVSRRLALASVEGLISIRSGEIAGAMRLKAGGARELAALLREGATTAVRRDQLAVRGGVSSSSVELAEAAGRYADASLVLRHATGNRPVAAFDELPVLAYLILAGAANASRLVGPGVRRLLADDRRGEWLTTLEAYADCDLSVGTAAARLGVHPNTVRYRLRQIERLTATRASTYHGLTELFAQLAVTEHEAL